MTHRFFLKLWPEIKLGAVVMIRKQNKHRAKWKLIILQKQIRSERFNQMLRSFFFMLIELCRRNLFLLDNSVWKKFGAVVIGSFTTTMPLPTLLECAAVLGKKKKTWLLSLILPIHQTLCNATFSCSLIRKARWKGNVLLMSVKCKRKCWISWTTSPLKRSRNLYNSGENVGASISSQKESTLKETSVIIV